MRHPALLAALALFGCSAAPPPDAEPPPPPAAASAAASAKPAAPELPKILVLGNVEDVVVASYPPSGFDKLTPEQRVLAYHLSRAVMTTDPLFTMQTSKQAWPITELFIRLVAAKDKIDPAVRAKIVQYRLLLFLNHGVHDSITGQKVPPPFTQAELEGALKAAGLSASKEILAVLFDPKVAANLTNKTPGKGKDPIVESAANHYEGVTSKDLAKLKDVFELNGRVVKEKGKVVEQVYRTGDGAGTPAGLGADILARAVKHLERAAAVAPPAERTALATLVRYFKTGDNALFREHDVTWLKQVFPVDYILGFVETYTDVREKKGSFEGFVAIPDPERDPPLQKVAKDAAYFEQKMPWSDAYKRTTFSPPAAAAVVVLAAAGDAGPFTFLGVNLPNAQDLRQKYGSKNFVVLSIGDTREELMGKRMIDEFGPEESRAEMHRCSRYLEYTLTSFHEVTGHGSGKVSPDLKADPAVLLAPYYSTMEEGRAELVADFLTMDPKTVELGLVPDAGCQKVLPNYVAMNTLMRHRTVPNGDAVEEDHFRADLVQQNVLIQKGIVKAENRGGRTTLVVADPVAWTKANGELLAEHQRIKATADKPALQALVEKYGTRLNPAWRDEVKQRLERLGLPRAIAAVPPVLTPVLDAQGNVVDAKATQSTSLEGYLAALEASWRD